MQTKAEYLFEISWEVCNKVGGIYTVLSSKADAMKKAYKNYVVIGPLLDQKTNFDFIKANPPQFFKEIFEELEKESIHCEFGEWKIDGEPKAILVDYKKKVGYADEIKKMLWERYAIDSLTANWDFTEPMVWSYCVSRLLAKIREKLKNEPVVGHFHEWLAGLSLLCVKMQDIKIATVFTTHATMLGRAIAGSNQELYNILPNINPKEEAYKSRVQEKYLTELACARHADMFTTVSEITGIEAEKILEKKPDMLLPNGLDIKEFPTMEEAALMHKKYRDHIREFLAYYFLPYYPVDFDESLIYFTTARNEFKNKGFDVLIDALGKMNDKMMKENSQKNVFMFFFVPDGVKDIRNTIIANREIYNEIKHGVEEQMDQMQVKVIRQLLVGGKIQPNKIFTKEFNQEIKKKILMFKKDSKNPPLCTHNLNDEANNNIMKSLYAHGLDNKQENRVKIIFYPIYISDADGLLNLKLYNLISGGHLGIFPSYYEPWGLTPVESIALGVPAITSDLSGFGRYIANKSKGGIFVLKRFERNYDEVVNDLTDMLYDYSKLKHKKRVDQKLKAKKIADTVSWSIFSKEYIKAHNLALEKMGVKK